MSSGPTLPGQKIAEYDYAAKTLIRAYVWAGDTPVAVVEGGQVYLVRTDYIGRPVFATDMAGAQVWSANYLPFGGVHVTTGTPIALRFPPLVHLADALPGSGPVVPGRVRPPPKLDAGL